MIEILREWPLTGKGERGGEGCGKQGTLGFHEREVIWIYGVISNQGLLQSVVDINIRKGTDSFDSVCSRVVPEFSFLDSALLSPVLPPSSIPFLGFPLHRHADTRASRVRNEPFRRFPDSNVNGR